MFKTVFYTALFLSVVCSTGWAQKSALSFEDVAKKGDVEAVLEFIKDDPSIKYPLHTASEVGNLNVINALLDAGHKINSGNATLERPLHKAANEGHLEAVKLLLKRGAQVNAKTKNGQIPLHRSVERGYEKISELLIQSGADINAKGNVGNTPIHLALMAKRDKLASALLKNRKVELFARNRAGEDYFDLAIDNESVETISVIIFLASGPKNQLILKGNKYFREGIFRAILADKPKSLDAIQKYAKIKDEEYDIFPPHFTAVEYGNLGIVKHFLSNGLDVNVQFGNSKVSLLHVAVSGNRDKTVGLLITNGAKIDIRDALEWTPLFYAIYSGHQNLIQVLLTNDADVHAEDYRGNTPMHMAIRSGSMNIVNMIIAKGGDLDAKNNEGVTPLDLVGENLQKDLQSRLARRKVPPDSFDLANLYVIGGYVAELDKFLSENEVDINRIKSEYSLFHSAIRSENIEMVKFLMKKGADIKLKTKGANWSPLHLSVSSLNVELINLLIMNGASVNEPDVRGMTPLHVAAFQSQSDVLRAQSNQVWDVLVTAGADPNIRNNNGQLAEQILIKKQDKSKPGQ
jgi:ankyrin repeat protein